MFFRKHKFLLAILGLGVLFVGVKLFGSSFLASFPDLPW
ncbi:hypothetical protein CLROS_027270 [Clostridium felsineum]|uniref:Uncharacterized protein n=1 Tax=Clostridium felsineum TaxID=36839 RepID=A0A1S8LF80_9CLOT|nr:hypothetical protein CLAUR_044870 [Clostridium felsineum]URZ07389.1 hypothetical protein CLROS_027270 [Clostridium felsineum]URZ12420.1 hypothetical protein CROST_031420 [Clostridium felsineum]URZ17080.1 hypothetical protein CLFE_031320 [Clostridium felsineum DSM 794]